LCSNPATPADLTLICSSVCCASPRTSQDSGEQGPWTTSPVRRIQYFIISARPTGTGFFRSSRVKATQPSVQLGAPKLGASGDDGGGGAGSCRVQALQEAGAGRFIQQLGGAEIGCRNVQWPWRRLSPLAPSQGAVFIFYTREGLLHAHGVSGHRGISLLYSISLLHGVSLPACFVFSSSHSMVLARRLRTPHQSPQVPRPSQSPPTAAAVMATAYR
jgi:hypothetical protein